MQIPTARGSLADGADRALLLPSPRFSALCFAGAKAETLFSCWPKLRGSFPSHLPASHLRVKFCSSFTLGSASFAPLVISVTFLGSSLYPETNGCGHADLQDSAPAAMCREHQIESKITRRKAPGYEHQCSKQLRVGGKGCYVPR